jgi:hypothetical protein
MVSVAPDWDGLISYCILFHLQEERMDLSSMHAWYLNLYQNGGLLYRIECWQFY